jgi:hypothetical protein
VDDIWTFLVKDASITGKDGVRYTSRASPVVDS